NQYAGAAYIGPLSPDAAGAPPNSPIAIFPALSGACRTVAYCRGSVIQSTFAADYPRRSRWIDNDCRKPVAFVPQQGRHDQINGTSLAAAAHSPVCSNEPTRRALLSSARKATTPAEK